MPTKTLLVLHVGMFPPQLGILREWIWESKQEYQFPAIGSKSEP